MRLWNGWNWQLQCRTFLYLSHTFAAIQGHNSKALLIQNSQDYYIIVSDFWGASVILQVKHKMDIVRSLSQSDPHVISCIEIHTTGEPVRIVYHGYPELSGTLMEQRRQAKLHHDTIRRRLMFKLRGYNEMLAIFPLVDVVWPFISPIHTPA